MKHSSSSFLALFTLRLCLLSGSLTAQNPAPLNLWPGPPPGPAAKVKGDEADFTKDADKLIAGRRIIKLGNVSTPQMQVFLAPKSKANGGAVLVLPGGGFSILAWDLEGTEVAEWLNSLGLAAIVVKYRVPTREHGDALNEQGTVPLKALGPVMDAQRALSLTRANAKEWGLDPKRIGLMGFSAGGATAGITALQHGTRSYAKIDAVDEQSCGVDFAMLIYPAYLMDKETGNLSSFLKVTKDSPRTFMIMAQDDPIDSRNCTVLYTALTIAKVPAEVHLYPRGGHGYGLRGTDEPVTNWPAHAEEWLKHSGFLTPAADAAAGTK
jgi:acetyl esterase/lipase